MFDPNNDINYSPGGYSMGPDSYSSQGYGPESQASKMDIKKYLPMIIGLGILLIVAFFLLTWLGSQREIWIELTDADGKQLTDADGGIINGTLRLTDSSGNIVESTTKGNARKFKFNLFPGEYYARVTAEGYKTRENEVIVIDDKTQQNSTESIKLTRNLDATITLIIETTKIYEGQVIEGKMIIYNSGDKFSLEDIISTTPSPLEVTIHPTTAHPYLNAGGSATLDFSIKVKDGTSLTKKVDSTISFKIRGSNITSKKSNITMMPTINPNELTISGLPSTTVTLNAGVQKEVSIVLKNNSKEKIPLENLLVEVVPSVDFEDKIEWITIADISDESLPNEINISSIEPTKSVTIKMFVKSPIDSEKDEEFRGLIRITSLSLKEPKISNIFSYKVKTETKVALTFTMPDEFIITCNENTGECKGEKTLATGEVYFKNDGDIDIGPISLRIKMEAQETTNDCPSFLKLITTTIPGVPKKIKYETISINITNPPESPNNVTEVCVLEWVYNNPIDLSIRESGEKSIKITKKTT